MFRFLVFVLVLACCAIPASATLTTYTTQSSFAAATTDQTFQNITFPSGNDGTSLTDATVVFSSADGLTGVADPTSWPVGSSLEAAACPGGCSLTITLPAAVTSVSLYVGTDNFNPFQITVSNGVDTPASSNQAQNPVTIPFFFGFVSTVPFTTFTIATEDSVSNLYLDNMQIGTPSGGGDAQAPEAATFLMIGTGLIMLHFGKRWLPRAS